MYCIKKLYLTTQSKYNIIRYNNIVVVYLFNENWTEIKCNNNNVVKFFAFVVLSNVIMW